MKKLLSYLKPQKRIISVTLIIKFIGSIMDLIIPWILAYLIDDIVPLGDVPLVLIWGGVMVLAAIMSLVANIISNRLAARGGGNVTRQIRHDLFSKTMYLSCKKTDEHTTPSLISRLTSDTYHVHHMLVMLQRIGVRAPSLLIGGILITLTLDPVLTLVMVAVLPLISGGVFLISRHGVSLYQNLQKRVDSMVRVVRENITGVRIIKALSKSEYEKERYAKVNSGVMGQEKKAALVMGITNPLMNLFLNLGLTLVVLVGAYRVNLDLSQPGKIIAFLTYFTIILNAMMMITHIFVFTTRGVASFGRIAEVLDTPNDMQVLEPNIQPSPYHISFDHVSFSYYGGKNNLSDISFHLKRGETLGVIGATGSGKSSVIKLLMRFYDPDAGEIRISGQTVQSIPPQDLHTKFGIVFQNDVLFSDSIAENIDLGRGLEQERITMSAALAQAGEFIDSLDDGTEHELSVRGANLSGGQRQRILISRALAGEPEILVLDDSSSALDYRTDAKLRHALRDHFQQTTTIIIAQRVCSIMHADHILVLDEGRMLGYGTHEQLLKTCESYREISDLQMGGMEHA